MKHMRWVESGVERETSRGLLVERSAHQRAMFARPNLCKERRAPLAADGEAVERSPACGGRWADRGGQLPPMCQATEAAVI